MCVGSSSYSLTLFPSFKGRCQVSAAYKLASFQLASFQLASFQLASFQHPTGGPGEPDENEGRTKMNIENERLESPSLWLAPRPPLHEVTLGMAIARVERLIAEERAK